VRVAAWSSLALLVAGNPAPWLQGRAPVLRPGPPITSPAEQFAAIAGLRELADGRVLVADETEGRLVLLSRGGAAAGLGRRGAGPGELRSAGRVLPRPGGGAYVVDFAQRRLLPVAPDARLENPIAIPQSIMLTATNARGFLYGEAFRARDGGAIPDSMWIVRWDPSLKRIDTLMAYDAAVSSSVGPPGSTRRAFPPTDSWTALGNGDIVVVSAASYRVSIWREGRVVRSFAVPWDRKRVTAAERAAYAAARSGQRARSIGSGGREPRARSPAAREYLFPSTYPPFGGDGLGGRYLSVAPDGLLWVERLVPPGSDERRYDIVDVEGGALMAQFAMPAEARLAGFGQGSIWLAERDPDDVVTLHQYRYPAIPRR
jgi:hypothetical protein